MKDGLVAVINGGTVTSSPVSYTHLDVYKRQDLYRQSMLELEAKKLKLLENATKD